MVSPDSSLPIRESIISSESSKTIKPSIRPVDSKVNSAALIPLLLTRITDRDKKIKQSKQKLANLAKAIKAVEIIENPDEAQTKPKPTLLNKLLSKVSRVSQPSLSDKKLSTSKKQPQAQDAEKIRKTFVEESQKTFEERTADLQKQMTNEDLFLDLDELHKQLELLKLNPEIDLSLLLDIESQMRTFLKTSDYSESFQELYEKILLPMISERLEKTVKELTDQKIWTRKDYSTLIDMLRINEESLKDMTQLCEAFDYGNADRKQPKELKTIETLIPQITDLFGSEVKSRAKESNPIGEQAAHVGQSATKAIGALKALHDEAESSISINTNSAQDVFLLPKQGAVIKKGDSQARLEQRNVESIMNFLLPAGVISSFTIRKPALSRYGIKTSSDPVKRIPISNLSNDKRTSLLGLLSEKDKLILNKINEQTNIDVTKVYYRSEGVITSIKMQELRRKEAEGTWEFRTPISLSLTMNDAEPLITHIARKTALFQKFKEKPSEITLARERELKDNELIYVKLPSEKKGEFKIKQMTFKKLRELYTKDLLPLETLIEMPDPKITDVRKIKFSSFEEHIKDDSAVFKTISQVKEIPLTYVVGDSSGYKLITPELMKHSREVTELGEIEAQPFMENLILLGDAVDKGGSAVDRRDEILKKMTARSESVAVMSAVWQSLDFHDRNLGFQPTQSGEYELRAFDTDKSMAESNVLEVQLMNYHSSKTGRPIQGKQKQKEVLVPFRNNLLASTWKDQPLRKETIEHLLKQSEKIPQITAWVRKKDAPIHRRLSKETSDSIEKELTPILEKYTLSSMRETDSEFSFSDLQEKFMRDIAEDKFKEFKPLWEKIEKDLVDKKDFKPQIQVGDLTIDPKDTTADAEKLDKAIELRSKIAKQLFPRITLAQHNALTQRLEKTKSYITQYQELNTSTLKGEELLNKTEEFVNQNSSLFDAVKLASLKKVFTAIRAGKDKNTQEFYEQRIESIRKNICKDAIPTFFNISKAMYPLLANAYELNKQITGSRDSAGKNIGLYTVPLQTSIDQAKSTDPNQKVLADALKEQITSEQKPHFFGLFYRQI